MNRSAELSRQCTEETRPRVLPLEPLEVLARRSRRAADVVEGIQVRRDRRDALAWTAVLILESRCPLGVRPREPWYVPGAAARMGIEKLRGLWRARWNAKPPCKTTLLGYLAELEAAGLIVREPGQWFGRTMNGRPSQWGPTIHVLESEAAAEAWRARGAPALEAHPEAGRSPHAWRRHVPAAWRTQVQLELFPPAGEVHRPEGLQDRPGAGRAKGARLAARLALLLAAGRADALGILEAAQAAGAVLQGPTQWELVRSDLARLAGVVALLARALVRGDAIRNPAGWIVRANRYAEGAELQAALAWVLASGAPPP